MGRWWTVGRQWARGLAGQMRARPERRWWTLGRIGSIAIRAHWSVLVGILVFSGLRFAPGAWLGFVLLILVHELGHAAVAKITRQTVLGIDIHGLGGECRWFGNAGPIQRSAIAWGGVWAQMLLGAVALPFMILGKAGLGRFGYDFFYILTWGNLWLAILNLIPIRPLDGADAWKLPGLVRDWWRHERARRSLKSESPRPRVEGGRAASGPSAELPPELREVLLNVAKEAREARRRN